MPSLLMLAFAAAVLAPAEPLAGQLRAAIWNDLYLNAMIGNGNLTASLWYNAGQGSDTRDLHIRDLACSSNSHGYRCAFTLFRDGGVKTVLGQSAPDRLSCKAIFVTADDGDSLAVKHLPPHRVGHSRTTMECKPVAA